MVRMSSPNMPVFCTFFVETVKGREPVYWHALKPITFGKQQLYWYAQKSFVSRQRTDRLACAKGIQIVPMPRDNGVCRRHLRYVRRLVQRYALKSRA